MQELHLVSARQVLVIIPLVFLIRDIVFRNILE